MRGKPILGGSLVVAAALVGWGVWKANVPAIAIGTPAANLPLPEYVAMKASVDVRRDQRSSGLVLKHDVLRLTRVSRPTSIRLRGGTLIYTKASELEGKIDDVLDGRIPVSNGLEAYFAIGRLAPVTIVRLDEQGRVASVEDTRASFVAFTVD